ncbi:hypothetical protein ACD661_16205 [Legionella lytica]|uniref:Uncharacterized protein n=1 Tax=Legionella lytica TaxID=96232 RepID=A0ABW8DBJ7_9GAMM
MRLNKRKQAITIATLFSGLHFRGVGFCTQVDEDALAVRCERVYTTLDRMFEEQKFALCADDVEFARWVMEDTGALIRAYRYSDALGHLKTAVRELSDIYHKTNECAYFSPKVKPSLDEVHTLVHELEEVLMNQTVH